MATGVLQHVLLKLGMVAQLEILIRRVYVLNFAMELEILKKCVMMATSSTGMVAIIAVVEKLDLLVLEEVFPQWILAQRLVETAGS